MNSTTQDEILRKRQAGVIPPPPVHMGEQEDGQAQRPAQGGGVPAGAVQQRQPAQQQPAQQQNGPQLPHFYDQAGGTEPTVRRADMATPQPTAADLAPISQEVANKILANRGITQPSPRVTHFYEPGGTMQPNGAAAQQTARRPLPPLPGRAASNLGQQPQSGQADKGMQGAQPPQTAPASQAVPTANGTAAAQGQAPAQGGQGTHGANGINGAQGAQGANGAPATVNAQGGASTTANGTPAAGTQGVAANAAPATGTTAPATDAAASSGQQQPAGGTSAAQPAAGATQQAASGQGANTQQGAEGGSTGATPKGTKKDLSQSQSPQLDAELGAKPIAKASMPWDKFTRSENGRPPLLTEEEIKKWNEINMREDMTLRQKLDAFAAMLQKEPTKEEKEAEEKRHKRSKIFSSISDGIQALANLYFTTQYAPNSYDPKNSLSAKEQERWEKLTKEREDVRAKNIEIALKQLEAQETNNKNKGTWWKYFTDLASTRQAAQDRAEQNANSLALRQALAEADDRRQAEAEANKQKNAEAKQELEQQKLKQKEANDRAKNGENERHHKATESTAAKRANNAGSKSGSGGSKKKKKVW